ncbi:hypothetical protein GD416_05745 [Burkholderia sp. BE24]|uniref:hypothetical protein n=1 Tax=unclassified Burkholderia TaxID=2613784 RepID=UPI0011800706|nr:MULTISPECIES: hypothetical protein [unclassified Burkholderia]MPV55950.1 hypothetical protein [Burkholderia sp. BE24]
MAIIAFLVATGTAAACLLHPLEKESTCFRLGTEMKKGRLEADLLEDRWCPGDDSVTHAPPAALASAAFRTFAQSAQTPGILGLEMKKGRLEADLFS